jgi:hypothetical protein
LLSFSHSGLCAASRNLIIFSCVRDCDVHFKSRVTASQRTSQPLHASFLFCLSGKHHIQGFDADKQRLPYLSHARPRRPIGTKTHGVILESYQVRWMKRLLRANPNNPNRKDQFACTSTLSVIPHLVLAIILLPYYIICDSAGLIRHPRRPGSTHHFALSGNRFSVCSVDQLFAGQVLASSPVALDVDIRVLRLLFGLTPFLSLFHIVFRSRQTFISSSYPWQSCKHPAEGCRILFRLRRVSTGAEQTTDMSHL